MKKLMFLLVIFGATFLSCSDDLVEDQEIIINVNQAFIITVNKDTLLSLVNQARVSGYTTKGVYHPPVGEIKWNNKHEEASRLHSNYMFQFKTLAHTWSDGTNTKDRLALVNYTSWRRCGENCAHGNMDEKTVIQGWLNSPSHCKNIMSSEFKFLGVARTGDYWTMVLTD